MTLDYIRINDSDSLEELGDHVNNVLNMSASLLSGALWVGKTRLIDNIILGAVHTIIN